MKSKLFINFKILLKKVLPPIIIDIVLFLRNRISKLFKKRKESADLLGFHGIFDTWDKASRSCGSYNSNIILEKCKQSLLKVKNGEAAYERDSVLFDKVQYSWPVLVGLLYAATKLDGRLDLIDFGGSLGSSYYQNRLFLKDLKHLSWNIVEQPNFVEEGNLHFKNEVLNFYESIESCLEKTKVNVFLASSSFPYIREPFELIKKIINYGFSYIIIDRTYFIDLPKSIVSTQMVSPEIYDSSYPAWFFNLAEFSAAFNERYRLLVEFESYLQATNVLEGMVTKEMGMIFELRN
ncbi:methyltransferase, TIGR04325 family [Leptospira sp. 201903070]|uniref:Methyltransferase, TIGR04325 family n=1 Tax=Leptospira ainlahdjerensis TaxID=2810033 RepID=A0ABS2UEE9_9LEPT|nr:methyltransferase, TIGR04325 family [Leptospira ainlahdjerensis]MBM9577280.1 methyltransferase, TIGR04325 family [Leptospira ainlahdjerensis]